MLSNFTLAMEEYKRDKAVAKARAMLSLLNVSDEDLEKFDGLCRDFDLTIEDAVGWEDIDKFFNPQEHEQIPEL